MGNKFNLNEIAEVGRLYSCVGNINQAIQKLSLAMEQFRKDKDFKSLLKCQEILLRIYVERLELDKVNRIKEEIQDLVLKEGLELTSRTYYVLGVCASYKNQIDLAFDYYQKSLHLALSGDDKEDMCYAISGIVLCHCHKGNFKEALTEIKSLKVFFEVLDVPELVLNTQVIHGLIYRKQGRFEEALELFWDAYDKLKQVDNKAFFYSCLYNIGATYFDSGEHDLAKLYMQLAKRSIDANVYRKTAMEIDSLLQKLGMDNSEEFDLVINEASQTIKEKNKGNVEFKNQFILLDLLNLFVKNPGRVFSKEELVEKIWGQEYNPSVHDNKVYVTIKRLRKLIEPDYEKPHYIFRGKNGYFLNKAARVLIEKK